MPDVDVVELRNNAFDGIGTALYDDGDAEHTTIVSMETHLAGIGASGNVAAAIDFVDLDGVDGDLMTADDNDLRLAESAACEVREGGLDGGAEGWGTSRDASRYVRSVWLPGGPTTADAAGWSLGAFELRLAGRVCRVGARRATPVRRPPPILPRAPRPPRPREHPPLARRESARSRGR
jgi:hypothetical protein